MTIDSTWQICADPGTEDLAALLHGSHLLNDGFVDAALNGRDGFPVGAPMPMKIDGSVPAGCSLSSKKKMIWIRDWSRVSPAIPAADSRFSLLAAFPALMSWAERLSYDPQSYAISYNATNNQIVIVGGSAQGAQHGVVSWLRDSDHRLRLQPLQGWVSTIVWTPKSVLDYPELKMRVSSFRGEHSTDDARSVDWRNALTWNRYTHITNDGQLFNDVIWREASADVFDRMANYFTPRQIKLIPRLLSGQVSMDTPGPSTTAPASGVLPGPDLSGLLPNSNVRSVGGGIHLTEGMRALVSPNQTLVPPNEVVPVSWESLMMSRGKGCTRLKPGDETDDEADVQAEPIPYEHQHGYNGHTFVDCRTDDDGTITLCSDGTDCPTVNGGFTSGLAIYTTQSGNLADVATIIDGETHNSDGQPYPGYDEPPGYDVVQQTPYAFRPGHVYLLALRYRLDLGQNPSWSDVESFGATIAYAAGVNEHQALLASGDHYLMPTQGAWDWATYVFRVPEADAMDPATTANAIHGKWNRLSIGSNGTKEGAVDTALHLSTLQVFDLGDTLAYPVVEDLTQGHAWCGGLYGQSSTCTMAMTGWAYPTGRTYPDSLLEISSESCEHEEEAQPGDDGCAPINPANREGPWAREVAHLSMPSATLPGTGSYTAGHYRTVLTPGLWPRALDKIDPLQAAPFPSELLVGQDIERPEYWQPSWYAPGPARRQVDGFLGMQLKGLHTTVTQHPAFFEYAFVNVSNNYTEAKGFNRSQGMGYNPTPSVTRIADLHCRLQKALSAMGYGQTLNPNYTPSRPNGLAGGVCQTSQKASLLYYGDMFTPLHNGYIAYNAPHGGGRPWTPDDENPEDPLATPSFPPFNSGGASQPTFIPWWYEDDPEYLAEYFNSFEEHGYATLFWMGATSIAGLNAPTYHNGRGSQREIARLAAAHPESVYGAGTYYNSAFSASGTVAMSPVEERAWEQVSADCMWNPRWAMLFSVEMRPDDFVLPAGVGPDACANNTSIDCINAWLDTNSTDNLYYGPGPQGRIGTPESIRLKGGKSIALRPLNFSGPPLATDRRLLLRVFAKSEGSALLHVSVNGHLLTKVTAPSNAFSPIEITFVLPTSSTQASISLSNSGSAGILLDGLTLYEELPHFGYNAQNQPIFPSDIDERSSSAGWKYCDDPTYLSLGVTP